MNKGKSTVAATGWLPHTTRAALTRLRQAGHVLYKTTGESGTVPRTLPVRQSHWYRLCAFDCTLMQRRLRSKCPGGTQSAPVTEDSRCPLAAGSRFHGSG